MLIFPVPCRILLCCAVSLAFAPLGRTEQTTANSETMIRLTVYPKGESKPALRYVLLPELREMNPGNPISGYLRCFMDQDFNSSQEVLTPAALREADRAARLDKPDWQILLKAKTDGIGLLLPDLQKMRQLAAALQERFHQEVVQRRFDDAIRTAKTMFALAHHIEEHPTLIGDLVGVAIAFVTINPLEEMLQQPGCPNLYWALTNLPHPLVRLDRGMEGERMLIQAELRSLNDRDPMTKEQLKKLMGYVDRLRELESIKGKKMKEWMAERTSKEQVLRLARESLIDYGIPEQRVNRFPPEQLILLDEKRIYEVQRDDLMKLMNLPTWQVEKLYPHSKRFKDDHLFTLFIPAMIKVRRANGRLEQRIALLRHVEALRLYAASHAGKLPSKLSDCPVPLPDDPFTGKPFDYKVEGDTAHLRGSPPSGEEKNSAFNIHYEITMLDEKESAQRTQGEEGEKK